MKSKFASFIMSIIILLILAVLGLFGVIIFQEINNLSTGVEPENFQTVIEEVADTIEKNIETPKIIENSLDNIKDNKETVATVDYTSVKIDRYFYNQLEEYPKIIYNAFEKNRENLKTGKYQIELGNAFSDLLNKSNGQSELGNYYQSAIEAYTYDNPDVFYLSPNKMYLNIEKTTQGSKVTYNVFINSGSQESYLASGYESKIQIEQAISKIDSVKNKIVSKRTGKAYEDIKMVHDYLLDNIEYDTSISKSDIYNIYGALVNGEAVCEGYARSFKYIMDELQIPCVLVIGKGKNSEGQTENHAWNYVQLNGNWYAVDSTWDDPVVIGGGFLSKSSNYKYFLKGKNTMDADHIPSGQFTPDGKVFKYPNINVEDF